MHAARVVVFYSFPPRRRLFVARFAVLLSIILYIPNPEESNIEELGFRVFPSLHHESSYVSSDAPLRTQRNCVIVVGAVVVDIAPTQCGAPPRETITSKSTHSSREHVISRELTSRANKNSRTGFKAR